MCDNSVQRQWSKQCVLGRVVHIQQSGHGCFLISTTASEFSSVSMLFHCCIAYHSSLFSLFRLVLLYKLQPMMKMSEGGIYWDHSVHLSACLSMCLGFVWMVSSEPFSLFVTKQVAKFVMAVC